MKRILCGLVSVALACAAEVSAAEKTGWFGKPEVAAAKAEPKAMAPVIRGNDLMEGVVVSIDAKAASPVLRIKFTSGQEVEVSFDSKTAVFRKDQALSAADVKPGDRTRIEYVIFQDGAKIARNVEIIELPVSAVSAVAPVEKKIPEKKGSAQKELEA